MQLQKLTDYHFNEIVDLMTQILLSSNGHLNEDKLYQAILFALSGLEDDLYDTIENYYENILNF